MRFCHLALFLLLVQVSSLVSEDQQQCEPGFSEQRYAFTVNRKVLERGRIIGKVSFTSCSTNNRALYSPDDTRFRVFPDGKVTLKRQITLHDGSLSFVLNAWDAKGMRHSVPIFVWNEREQQKAHGKGKQPLLVFPEKPSGLKRRKRHWVIPPIRVLENLKGPFPKRFAQIRSTMEANMNILYSITGQGVDSPPEGVFSVEKETGRMMVNKPLDREEYASYTVLCHAVSLNGRPAEGPLQIIIQVLDQNDNRPKFTEEVFRGSVREGVTPGTPVMTITATDDDDPKTANAILGYSILKQEPEDPAAGLFTINSVSGVISVIGTGLDRERVPEYVLTVQVADMEGNGLSTTAKAVIQILDTNDNAPVFDPVKEPMSGGSLLSTHVLNTAQGIPAKGLTITLSKMDASQTKWVQVSRSVTNEDGRCPGLLRGEPLTAGTFQLRFDTKDYWKQMQQDSFYPYVEVVFTITDPQQKHHVPLLLSPFSYTTYRGS